MFQSTLPTRAATSRHWTCIQNQFVSIHAAHAGSDTAHLERRHRLRVSIHAAHAGSDARLLLDLVPVVLFQSTLPTRAATTREGKPEPVASVSIHAAHAGSDPSCERWYNDRRCFNPRCPRGQRPRLLLDLVLVVLFQSTLPTRAATMRRAMEQVAIQCFNPRCPRGQRPECLRISASTCLFQSTLPTRAATACI